MRAAEAFVVLLTVVSIHPALAGLSWSSTSTGRTATAAAKDQQSGPIAWTHRMRLDPNYDVYWTIGGSGGEQPDSITFEVQVKTVGYVIFGLSPTGLFQDADLVVGWVHNGRPRFQVRRPRPSSIIF